MPSFNFSLPLIFQGDLINQIEFNVDHAVAYVERGTQMLRVAASYKRKNRKVRHTPTLMIK